MPSPRVAFLGTGLMGSAMVVNVARADLPVTAWNRTPEKATKLAALGLKVATSAAEAVAGADVVCCIVTNADAVDDVLFGRGVADAMRPGAIFVDMSSIPPKVERRHAERLAALGIRHLDAPVSGGTRGAAEASLAIMVGGDKKTFVDAMPVLSAMGRPTRVGPDGAGQLAKLCNQVIVAIGIGGLSEALLLASAGGADPTSVREALRGGFSEGRILHEHGKRMLDRNWMPGAQVSNMLKDLNAVVEAAEDCGLDLPFVALARSLFQALHDRGVTGYDQTALLLEIERRNPPYRVGDKSDVAPH